MDDQAFEQWSENLAEMRRNRMAQVDKQMQDKGITYESKQFFDTLKSSLEEIVMKWWNIEQQSWEGNPPEDKAAVRELLLGEMESIIDFEIETLTKDLADVRKKTSWPERVVQKDQSELFTFSEELRKDYRIKVGALGMGQKKVVVEDKGAKRRPPPRVAGSRTQGGTGGILLFLVGIILGGGASITFWQMSEEAAKKHQKEMEEVRAEKRAVEDRLILIEDTFKNLAYAKIRNIPRIQKDIHSIKMSAETKRKKVRRYHSSRLENLLKKAPPGDKLDRSKKKLEEETQKKMDEIDVQENNRLKPFLKELQAFSDILGTK